MSDREPIRLYSDESKGIFQTLETSLSIGDPTLHDVLQWHMSLCPVCEVRPRPSGFGVKDRSHCEEYFGILMEYSEYESDYVSKGNP